MTEGRARQLILRFEPAQGDGEEDFLVCGPNAAAFDFVSSWPDWPDAAAILVGPPGGGKSHLAAIWARRAQALRMDLGALRAGAPLGGYYGRNILLESAESAPDEASLFHLFNLVQEARASLLMTSRRQPAAWNIALPDLRSRLRRAPLIAIEAPDEFLTQAVLVKLFADRQLLVEQHVVDFISLRIGRSLDRARRFVAAADAESLARGRPLTRAMAAQVFKVLGEEGGPDKETDDDEAGDAGFDGASGA